jgi:multiple sugar transport system substrate-binding protein
MSEDKMSRRAFLRGTVALAAAGALAACAPKKTAEPAAAATATPRPAATPVPAPEGTLVRFWTGWGGGTFAAAFQTITESEEFKAVLGNNTFEIKDSTGGEAMLTAIAGGDPPEAGSCINYLDFMARGACTPIEELVSASEVIKKEIFLEGHFDQCWYEGHMYGVPGIESFLRYGLNYNSKLVEEAGLDPDNPPVTWGEVYAWHEKLTVFDDAGNTLQIGLNPNDAMGEGVWFPDGWMAPISWGWLWFDAETGKFDINNEQMVDSFKTFKEFIDLVGVDNLANMYSVEGHGTWGGAYNAEVQAMIVEGYWHPGETMNAAPEVGQYNRATWLPVPDSRRGTKVQGGGAHMILFFEDAKNTEGMFAVAEFLQGKVACDAFWDNLGWLPSVKSYYDTVDPSIYPGLDFYFDSIDKITEWWPVVYCPVIDFVSNEYYTLTDQVNRAEVTPEEAAAELETRCQQEYDAAGFS